MIDGSGGCWAEWIMVFVRAQTTQVTQLLSVKGMSAKNYVCKNYVRREKDSAHTCHAEAPVG